jgi:hypothetical protein
MFENKLLNKTFERKIGHVTGTAEITEYNKKVS